MRSKVKYSLFQNIKYVYSNMWHFSRSLVIYSFIRMPLNVLQPFWGIYLSSSVVGAVANNYTPRKIIVSISVILLIALILNILILFLSGKIQGLSLGNRLEFLQMTAEKSLSADYENIENPDGQTKMAKAMACLSSNSSSGEAIINSMIDVVSSFLGILSYGTVIAAINPIVIAIILVSAIINFFILKRRNRREMKNRDNYTSIDRKLDYLCNRSMDFSSAKDIKLFHMSAWLGNLFDEFLKQRTYWIKKSETQGFFVDFIGGILTLIRDGICFGWLVYMIYANQLNADSFVLYFGIIGGFSTWIYGFSEKWAVLDHHSTRICELREFLDMKDSLNHNTGIPLPTQDFSIEFRNVNYRYPGAETNAVDNFNLKIENGEKIAIVGVNGAGKTTLVKLLCGFYKITNGEILVGGNNILNYNIDEYYADICAVFQDMNFLPVSIEENITLGRPCGKDGCNIDDAIEMSGLKSTVESLPHGKKTVLGKIISEDSVELSGGEKQKLALARALYKGGNILILDEPTAALDPIAENKMYLKYNEMSKGKTSLFISHRLASTRFCDKIILLEKGRIIETGTHSDLMEKGGKYAEMFELQSHYYKEGIDDYE